MIRYKIGYNYSTELVDIIDELNHSISDARIDGVYASSSDNDSLTARPKYRLPPISMKDIGIHIKKLHSIGVEFFYALNSPFIGKKSDINLSKIADFAREIEYAGADGVILTHPLIADCVRRNTGLKIELSSIANTFSANQFAYWREKYGINSVCLPPHLNRDIGKLELLHRRADLLNCNLELIVNELCGLSFGSGSSYTPCIYRETCFDCHSQNVTEYDCQALGGYPQSICHNSRNSSSISFWAKLRMIRPEDVKLYSSLGITNFKITGRTATIGELKNVVSAYMKFDYDGDISSLWYMPKNSVTINNKLLNGIAKKWFENRNHRCDENICGVTCKYCDDFVGKKIASAFG